MLKVLLHHKKDGPIGFQYANALQRALVEDFGGFVFLCKIRIFWLYVKLCVFFILIMFFVFLELDCGKIDDVMQRKCIYFKANLNIRIGEIQSVFCKVNLNIIKYVYYLIFFFFFSHYFWKLSQAPFFLRSWKKISLLHHKLEGSIRFQYANALQGTLVHQRMALERVRSGTFTYSNHIHIKNQDFYLKLM